MKIDWERVKKQTLWSYDDLIKKLLGVLTYEFVQEYYNHTMGQARGYAEKVRWGYLQNQDDKIDFVNRMLANFEQLENLEVGTYSSLIHQIETRERCLYFLQQSGFDFDQLIQTLNFILRWVLPFKAPLREFIEAGNDFEVRCLEVLKKHRLGSNLNLLESGWSEAGRLELSRATELPLAYLTALVNKADISRLAYVRGKTVNHLCGGGYNTLEKIAGADLAEMEKTMDAYYRTLGKSSADFEAVIPLSWMIGGAKILPRIVK